MTRRPESAEQAAISSESGGWTPRSPSNGLADFGAPASRLRPFLAPTIAPLGRERLIAVRYILDCDVVVTGGVTGRQYHFAAGQSRDIPLSDARVLVSEGDFGFSGGR